MESRFMRQSFLGAGSEDTLKRARVAIIGLCGGGSHVAQQLAHIGVGNLALFDHDTADETNLNRMVWLTDKAAKAKERKTDIIKAAVRAVNPQCNVRAFPSKWQQHAAELQACDVVVGCVDSYAARDDLERYARRYLMPYIDIGMDVLGGERNHLLSGQIIVSMPGHPCMHCMAFLTAEKLGKEADAYGNAGGKPQVVWPNGVLASTAVGKLMALLCPWKQGLQVPLYSIYDGNRMTVEPSPRLAYLEGLSCPHYPIGSQLGDTTF